MISEFLLNIILSRKKEIEGTKGGQLTNKKGLYE